MKFFMKKLKLFATNAHLFEEDNKGNEEADLIKKSIQVYKTDKYYKIITMYRTESWTYLLGEPVFLLAHQQIQLFHLFHHHPSHDELCHYGL